MQGASPKRMDEARPIPSVPFEEVVENLPRFMTTVAHAHALRIVERGQDAILALPLSDLPAALASCTFDARVVFGETAVVATLPQFGLVASGADFELAIGALADELAEYAADFLSDFNYYRRTDRVTHLPWLLRVALTAPAERRELLCGDQAARAGSEGPLSADTRAPRVSRGRDVGRQVEDG